MSPKCGTIGTVQQKFPGVPRNGIHPRPQRIFQGQISGQQAIGERYPGAKQGLYACRIVVAQNPRMNRTGSAQATQARIGFDGIRDFAGNGS